MKKKSILILVALLSISIISNAQIKIHSSGGISIGTLDDPNSGYIDLANPLLDLNINGVEMEATNSFWGGKVLTFAYPGAYLQAYPNISTSFQFVIDRDYYSFDEEIHTPGVIISSDIRLKENIVKIKDEGPSLDKLSKLEGIKYTFKDEKNGLEYAGFSAQELQKIIPHLVAEDEEGELSVNYIGLIPYLVEALKEQEEKINQLTILLKELSK